MSCAEVQALNQGAILRLIIRAVTDRLGVPLELVSIRIRDDDSDRAGPWIAASTSIREQLHFANKLGHADSLRTATVLSPAETNMRPNSVGENDHLNKPWPGRP